MIRKLENYDKEVEIDTYTFLSNREWRVQYRRPRSRNYHTNQVAINRFSYHAQLRTAQRSLSCEDVAYILRYGRCYHAAAAVFYLLLGKDIPEDDCRTMSRLIGTAVVVNKEHSTIITVWRNQKHAVRNIRRKLGAV